MADIEEKTTNIETKTSTKAVKTGKDLLEERRQLQTKIGKHAVISFKERPGYKRRVVNEVPGRVEKFLAAGWSIVADKDQLVRDPTVKNPIMPGNACRFVVNTRFNATCKTAVLMEIPIEYYEADQMLKEEENKRIEDSYKDYKARNAAYADFKNEYESKKHSTF